VPGIPCALLWAPSTGCGVNSSVGRAARAAARRPAGGPAV